MKFKDLGKSDIKKMKKVYTDESLKWDEKMIVLMDSFGICERSVRRWLVRLGLKEKDDPIPEQFEMAQEREYDTTKKRFLISLAQNNTPVHKKLLKNMEAYAEHIDAEILIIPGRYSNRMETLRKDTKESWVEDVAPYLIAKRIELCENLLVLADVKVQQTATNPLSSLESLSTNKSCVVGHSRVQLKTLPVFDTEHKPRVVMSTGACTIPNYTNSKIGAIGEFHHVFGFVVVELKDDNKTFFIRQVTAKKNGDFIDLFHNVSDGKVTKAKDALALIKGDIHYGGHDEKILDRTFKDVVPRLKPKQIFLHDVADFYSINHHESKNFVSQYRLEVEGRSSLKNEIEQLMTWLDKIKHLNINIVFSNHHQFLEKFIIESDPKKSIKNALEYMEYAKILLENRAPNGLLAYIISEKYPEIKCLGRNESYVINGWELAMHGMDGISGSRGSITQYRKLNSKSIIGHSHNAQRVDGTVQVGCACKLRQGYNNGMSNWVWSDAVITANGKVQQIIYIGEEREYTTFK